MNYLNNQNWTFPVPIRYGPGRLKELQEICQKNKINNPLIITDKGSANLDFILALHGVLKNE